MTMRLADDELVIALGNERITLRVSLRAALLLERRYGGFQSLYNKISKGELQSIADLVTCCGGRKAREIVLRWIGDGSIGPKLTALLPDLQTFIFRLCGAEDTAVVQPNDQKQIIAFPEYYEHLFSVATGWLGWAPEAAWRATPAEIMLAHKGWLDKHAAIHGKPDDDDNTIDLSKPADRARFRAIGNLDVSSLP